MGLTALRFYRTMTPCCLVAAWGFALGDPLFFERKFFPDRLGLGPVLPLYLDNDSFGVGMHAVYHNTGIM